LQSDNAFFADFVNACKNRFETSNTPAGELATNYRKRATATEKDASRCAV
jgi:hypothetical protein